MAEWSNTAPDQSWTPLCDALVWVFSLYLLLLRQFPSVDCFLGWSCDRQDLGELASTGFLGLVKSHPTVAMWSLHLHFHFHPKALQIPEHLILMRLSSINAKCMEKKTQVHKGLLIRKSYFHHLKRCLNWTVAPAKAGTSNCTVELRHFLGHHQTAWAWDTSTNIPPNVKPQCSIWSSPQNQLLDDGVVVLVDMVPFMS